MTYERLRYRISLQGLPSLLLLCYVYAFLRLGLSVDMTPVRSLLDASSGQVNQNSPSPRGCTMWEHAGTQASFTSCSRQIDPADLAFSAGDYPSAVLLYHERLRDAPNDRKAAYDGLFQLSRCYQKLGVAESAAYYAMQAYTASQRGEPLYEMGRFYEEHGDSTSAADFYALACQAPLVSSHLEAILQRLDRDRLWPRAFPSFYLEELAACQNLLDDPTLPDAVHAQLHWDMVNLARPLLQTGHELFRREGVFEDQGEYYYATPSIVFHPNSTDDHLVLVRLLNYRIDHEGRYYRDYLPVTDTSGVLRSTSALFLGHAAKEGRALKIDDAGYERAPYRFMGTEDPRIFRMENGDIRVLWISWEYAKHVGEGSRMASGILDLDRATVKVDHLFPSPCDRFLEKNWVMLQVPGGPLQFVYEWHPIRVGRLGEAANATSTIVLSPGVASPASFRHIRGSSNGVYHRGELWFLVHGTSWHQGPGPLYYHRMVVLDPHTFSVKRATVPFKLESADAPVEFSLGMTIDGKGRVTIGYSVWDGTAVLRRIDMWKVEALMASNVSVQ